MRRLLKKMIPLLLSILMAIAIMPQIVFAEDAETKGTGLTYLEIMDLDITENTCGNWSCDEAGNNLYYNYYPENSRDLQVTIEYDEEMYSGSWRDIQDTLYELTDEWQWLYIDCDSWPTYEKQWTLGSTHTLTASLMGKSDTFDVTIIESQVTDLQIEDLEIVEYTNGYWTSGPDDGQYFFYNLERSPLLKMKLTYEGDTFTGTWSSIEDDLFDLTDEWPSLDLFSFPNQSYDRPWTAGNTYTVLADVWGKTATFTVKIKKSPLTSFKVADLSIMEGTCGYNAHDENGNTYFEYYPMQSANFSASIVYDGKTYTGRMNELQSMLYEWTGDYPSYNLTTDPKQSAATPWKVNQTITATMELAGLKSTFKIKITPSLLTKITLDNIEILEETNGEQYNSFYYYYFQQAVTGSFVYNGKEYRGTYSELMSQLRTLTGSDPYFSFVAEKPQSPDTPWLPNNSYKVTASVMGKSCSFYVKIKPAVTPTAIKPIAETNLVFYRHCYYYNTFWGVTYEPANAKQGTTWESEDTSIIEVYGTDPVLNSFSFNGSGTTKVTATSKANPSLKQTFTVTIKDEAPPAGTYTTTMKAGKWDNTYVYPTDLKNTRSFAMKVGDTYALEITLSSPRCIELLDVNELQKQLTIADVNMYDGNMSFEGGKITRTMLLKLTAKKAGIETLTVGDYTLRIGVSEEGDLLFSDVLNPDAWYYKTVYDIAGTVNAQGHALMSGYSNGSGNFGPSDPLTRQDFAVILYRLADEPAVPDMENPFKDTNPKGYYYTCVLWAKANNVIAGYNDGRFGVGDKITREQVATILYRFAKDYLKIDTSEALAAGDLSKFKDGKAVSSWAEEALTWATGAGVISGKD
ncbi:MAG: S-layer homology domain-containing protein, partial [Lachnospiraceae bacterium]|nr:S-layer homology domain-containing protein [Lachnospiraceae bacterium]